MTVPDVDVSPTLAVDNDNRDKVAPVNWSRLLARVRRRRSNHDSGEYDDGDRRSLPNGSHGGDDDDQVWIKALARQLSLYCSFLFPREQQEEEEEEGTTPSDPTSVVAQSCGPQQEEAAMAAVQSVTTVVIETRRSLRFGMVWIASFDNNEEDGGGDGVGRGRYSQEDRRSTAQQASRRRERRVALQITMLSAVGRFLLRILSAQSSTSSLVLTTPTASLLPSSALPEPDAEAGAVSVDDLKCKLYAARLLCNLVTDNQETARMLLVYYVLPRGAKGSSLDDGDTGNGPHRTERLNRNSGIQSSSGDEAVHRLLCGTSRNIWVDLLVRNAGHRDVLAALVATLHNALAVADSSSSLPHLPPSDVPAPVLTYVTNQSTPHELRRPNSPSTFAMQLSRHTVLINTLLRQVVSVQSIAPLLRLSKPSSSPPSLMNQKNDGGAGGDDGGPIDDAGEWILVLLVQGLVRRGHLRTLYVSLSGSSTEEEHQVPHQCYGALPEHLVLLFCVQHFLHAPSHHDNSTALLELCCVPSDTVDTVLFLAEVYSELSAASPASHLERQHTTLPHWVGSPLLMERFSVKLRILELVADLLQRDSSPCDLDRHLREALGGHVSFLRRLSADLAWLVDRYLPSTQKSQNFAESPALNSRPANAGLIIPPQDQEWLTSLVRLLGNLCYRCRSNQDQMRLIIVPPLSSFAVDTTAATSQGLMGPTNLDRRNVLHVFLTSTSLAPYCFTLREWAVVAVRNALEDNAENQSILAQLQAQQSVSSAAHADMGIRIDFDAAAGTVRIVPTDSASPS